MQYAIIDFDEVRRQSLQQTLQGRGLEIVSSGAPADLQKIVTQAQVLIAVGSCEQLGAMVKTFEEHALTRPVVLATQQGRLGDLVPLLHGSVYGMVTFDQGLDALESLLRQIALELGDTNPRISGVDAAKRGLSMLRRAGASGLLAVRSEGDSGQILLRQGHIVDAEVGPLRGQDAAAALIAGMRGEVQLGWSELGDVDSTQPKLKGLSTQDAPVAPSQVLGADGQPLQSDPRVMQALGPSRVLFVDDDASLRVLYQKTFEHAGFRVCCAADGVEALELALRERPHVIISDIMMPRLDGWGLLSAVHADYRLRELPFVLLSAHGDFLQDLRSLDVGADAYLSKTLRREEIVASVRRLDRPRLELLSALQPATSLKGHFGRLGPLTLVQLLAARNATGKLLVEDRWARFELWFASGIVAQVRACVGEMRLGDDEALRSLLGARDACWVFEADVEPESWTLQRPAEELIEEVAHQATQVEREVRERMMGSTARLVALPERMQFYQKVIPPALTEVLSEIRAGRSPREIVAQGRMSPLVVDWLFKDMLSKGVARFAETT